MSTGQRPLCLCMSQTLGVQVVLRTLLEPCWQIPDSGGLGAPCLEYPCDERPEVPVRKQGAKAIEPGELRNRAGPRIAIHHAFLHKPEDASNIDGISGNLHPCL
eukprot:14978554-Alexandrium_andersonii.AAC.2